MFATFTPRTHQTIVEPQTDDGYYLVKDAYQMAFPPLRAYFEQDARPKFTGNLGGDHNATPIMSYNTKTDASANDYKNNYVWGWLAPGADPVASLTFNSVYWQSYESMTALQSISGNSFNYIEQHFDGSDGAHIVSDGGGGGDVVTNAGTPGWAPLVPNDQQVQTFGNWCGGWAEKELFIAGNVIQDVAVNSQNFNILGPNNSVTISIIIKDNYSRPSYGWDAGSQHWVYQGSYFTECSPVTSNIGPGYFEVRAVLADMTRSLEFPTYVNLTIDPFANPSPPAFTPPNPIPSNYVWPANDGAGMTYVPAFDPSEITSLAIIFYPNSTTVQPDAALKANLWNVRFRDVTGTTGIIYTGDDWLINSPTGIPTPYQTNNPLHFGEGYQLTMEVEAEKALKFVAANNRFTSENAYPFSIYCKFSILNSSHITEVSPTVPGTIFSLGGSQGDDAYAFNLSVQAGYPYIQIDQPNFDSYAGPFINTDGSLAAGETAVMATPPSNGKYGANWQLNANTTYEMIAVAGGSAPDTNGHLPLKLYMLDGGQTYLVGWININNSGDAAARYAGLNGTMPEICFGADNFQGGAASVFGGSILEARLYHDALTSTQMNGITANGAYTDSASSVIDQCWQFPVATASWNNFIDPSTPVGTVFPAQNHNALDAAETDAAVPQLSLEVRDENSVDYYSRIEFDLNVPISTSGTITIPLDTTPTPGGSFLDPGNIVVIFASTFNGPADGINIKQFYFKQLNYVMIATPEALPVTFTQDSLNIGNLKSLFYRMTQTTPLSGTVPNVAIQVQVWDALGPSDPFTGYDIFPLPAPGTPYFNEIAIEDMVTATGRQIDPTQLTKVVVTQCDPTAAAAVPQTFGAATANIIEIERLDYRQTHWIYINWDGNPDNAFDENTGTFDHNFANPFLNIPNGYDLYVEGVNNSAEGGARDVIIRLDDFHSSSYATRHDDEIIVGPGAFAITEQLDGMRTNNGATVLDHTQLAKLNISVADIPTGGNADVLLHLVRFQKGFSFVYGKGWHFGDPNYKQPANFTQINPGDPSLVAQAGTSISTRTTPNERDSLVQSVLENVSTWTQTGLTPGDYHLRMYAGWEGQYEVGPAQYLSRTVSAIANGTTTVLDTMDYTSNVAGWRQDVYLKGRAYEGDLVGTITPYDLYGVNHGDPLDADITIGSDGTLVIQYEGSNFATCLCAVILEPVSSYTTPQSDIAKLDAYRKKNFNGFKSIIPISGTWPTVAAGALEIVEVPFEEVIREPANYIANRSASSPTAHQAAPGSGTYALLTVLSGSTGTPTIVHTPPTLSGVSLETEVRFGQWIYGSGLTIAASVLRGDIENVTLKANLPRPIAIHINIPYSTPPGTYTGSLEVTLGSTSVTKNYVVHVQARNLPQSTKAAGMYVFNTTPEYYWKDLNTTEFTAYEDSLLRDMAVLNANGASGHSIGYSGDLTLDTGAFYDASISPYATNRDFFLQTMKNYKSAGYGNAPYHLYHTFGIMCANHSELPAINGNNIATVGSWTVGSGNPYIAYDIGVAHDAYRVSLGLTASNHLQSMYFTPQGVTQAVDGSSRTLIALGGNSVLMYVNGVNIPFAAYTYNQGQTITMNAPGSGGVTLTAGDIITIKCVFGDSINGYTNMASASPYVGVYEQIDWFHNRMQPEFDIVCADFKAVYDIMRADTTGVYPTLLPMISLSDEVDPMTDSSGNYVPAPQTDFILQGAIAIHRNMSYAVTCGNFRVALALTVFEPAIDFWIVDNGAGITQNTVDTQHAAGKGFMIYNTGNYRGANGFLQYKMGYDGFVQFASNSNSGDPYDPTDAEEIDVIQGVYPQPQTNPNVADIGPSVGAQLLGVEDYRWCLWLDQQIANSVAGAAAVKSSILGAIQGNVTALETMTPADMNGWRKQITDFADTLPPETIVPPDITVPTIIVTPSTLPDAQVGTGYSQTLTWTGGLRPYHNYAITAGSLPAGLSYAVTGSSSITISGTPTADGTFSFTASANDSNTLNGAYTGTQAYSIVVAAAPVAGDLNAMQIADGAIHLYPLNDAESDGGAADLGNSPVEGAYSDGTTYQVASLTGTGNNAVQFTANGGLTILNDTFPGGELPSVATTGFCYEFLFNFQELPQPYQNGALLANGGPEGGDGNYGTSLLIDFNDNLLKYYFCDDSVDPNPSHSIVYGTEINPGQTYHVVIDYDAPSKTFSMYLNGTLVNSVTTAGNYVTTYRPMGLGWNAGFFAYSTNATYQDFALYPAPLGQTKVTAHFNATGLPL